MMMTTEQQKQVQILELQKQIGELNKKIELLSKRKSLKDITPKQIYTDYLRLLGEDAEPKKAARKYIDQSLLTSAYTKDYGIDTRDFVSSEFQYTRVRLNFDEFTLVVVDQKGGGEGSGEHWHSVLKAVDVADSNIVRYFYIPGYYASYDGTTIDFDDIYEVTPFEKVVIDWKRA